MTTEQNYTKNLLTLETWAREIEQQTAARRPIQPAVQKIIQRNIDQTINTYARMPAAAKDSHRAHLITVLSCFQAVLE